MDTHTPVGSLDIWLLDCPTSTPVPTASSIETDALKECGKGASAPVAIPRQHNTHAARTLDSPNPETRSSCMAPWETKPSWLGEEDVREGAKLSNDLVWEGTVRCCRPLDVQSPIGQLVSVPSALRDSQYKQRGNGVTSTAASLPLFTTIAIEVSPMSLASLCRTLSSPAQQGKTLAFAETDSVTCVRGLDRSPTRQCSVLPTHAGVSMSACGPIPVLGGPNPSTTSSVTRVIDQSTRAVCEGTCPADSLVAFRAESTPCVMNNRAAAATAVCELAEPPAAASARANFPHHGGLSTKRGLYEGTVRGASMRNTWQYISCCTAAG
ncbi:hypothetical protein VaNZ11_002918 [Volvox africanus]|uniref:Uncharacterized protein n=1 Tax=Volvox africanus TaxID=51714 RepID=A0ABQ5RT75_9CHLO|nr:hypothetical protein VaNZ11_002918 [Volvox africanus]